MARSAPRSTCACAGGTATLHSAPGQGTTVRLEVAAAQGMPAPTQQPASPLPRDIGKRVLLVGQRLGVECAGALRWRQQRQPPEGLPDLMLPDVVMPGELDGLAQARHVRTRFPCVGILRMSGYKEQLDTVGRLGFDLLPKPTGFYNRSMTPQDQLQVVQEALLQLRAGRASASSFSEIAAGQHLLHAALPARFTQAMDQLRDRLESSALFSEESCSFSQTELWDAMQLWIDKAGEQPGLQPHRHTAP